MLRLILGRLVSGFVVILAVATFAFFSMRAAPGGPFDDELVVPAAIKRNIEKRYDLDKSVVEQYVLYMKGLLTELDLGHSLKRSQTVWEIVEEHFPKTVILGLLALGFAVIFGVLLGVIAATRQNTWVDHASMGFSMFGISIPNFVLGPILIAVFSLQLGWLPPARFEGLSSMILPALTLGLIYMGVVARLSRGGLLETIRQDYIRTARAKGLGERTVVWKHAVRLGLVPVMTYLGPATARLVAGSFVVEQIFQIPGLGFYFVASITDRDFPVLTGVLVFYAVLLVTLNLLVDIAYGVIDPRVADRR